MAEDDGAPFTEEQLNFLRRLIEQSLIAKSEEVNDRRAQPGTVMNYYVRPDSRLANVLVDGDDAPTLMADLSGKDLVVGQRVMVKFEPPQGLFVSGLINPAPEHIGITMADVAVLPDDDFYLLEGDIAYSSQYSDAFLSAFPEPTFTVPDNPEYEGFYGITVASMMTDIGFTPTRHFVDIVVDDGVYDPVIYRGSSYAEGPGIVDKNVAMSITAWLQAGSTVQLRAYQVSGATRNARMWGHIALIGKSPSALRTDST